MEAEKKKQWFGRLRSVKVAGISGSLSQEEEHSLKTLVWQNQQCERATCSVWHAVMCRAVLSCGEHAYQLAWPHLNYPYHYLKHIRKMKPYPKPNLYPPTSSTQVADYWEGAAEGSTDINVSANIQVEDGFDKMGWMHYRIVLHDVDIMLSSSVPWHDGSSS